VIDPPMVIVIRIVCGLNLKDGMMIVFISTSILFSALEISVSSVKNAIDIKFLLIEIFGTNKRVKNINRTLRSYRLTAASVTVAH